jgi:hypothetical protein
MEFHCDNKNLPKFYLKSITAELIFPHSSQGRAAVLDMNWLKLYQAAILEINPDELPTRIEAAEQAIVEQESRPDITELERRKLADARSMLKTLSRIASSDGKRAAHDAALPHRQHERLG